MNRKPVVSFDPRIKEHRQDAYVLMSRRGLSFCKNHYSLEGNYGDTMSMITDRTLQWYLDREFDKS